MRIRDRLSARLVDELRSAVLGLDRALDASRKRVATKHLEQVLLRLSDLLVEAKKDVARAIADEKRLRALHEQERAAVLAWRQRADQAAEVGADELAREASEKCREHELISSELATQWMEQKQAVDVIKRRLHSLHDRIERTKRIKHDAERRITLDTARRTLVRFDLALGEASALLSELANL